MKCEHCGIEMDNPMIFNIHESRCLEDQKANAGLIEEGEQEGKENDIDYNSMTVDQLKVICKEKNLEGYSNLNKEDLVKFIQENLKK